MRVPFSWLREYCDPGIGAGELAERLAMTGTEVERVVSVGPPSAEGFVVGRVLEREKHPDADRLSVCTVDTGDGEPRTIVCGAPNVDAGQTVAGGAARRDDARRREARQGEAARGRVARDDPLRRRARGRRGVGGDHGARRRARAGHAAERGSARRRAGAGARGDAEPGRLLRRLRRRPRGPRDQRRAAGARALGGGRRRRGRGRGGRLRIGDRRGAGALPALHRARLHRRDDRPLAGLAAGAAQRRRAAADQQRRRHH